MAVESHATISSYNAFSFFKNNSVSATGSNTGGSLTYYHLGSAPNSNGAKVSDNIFDLGSSASIGVKVDSAGGAVTTAPGGPGLYINNNLFRDAKQGVAILNPSSFSELFIEGNTFVDILSCAIDIICNTTSSLTYEIKNVKIDRNIIEGGGTVYLPMETSGATGLAAGAGQMRPAISIQGDGGIENLSLSNNQITTWSISGDDSPYQAIYAHLGDSNSMRVQGNIITDLGYTSGSFAAADKNLCGGIVFVNWYNNVSMGNLSLSNNTVYLKGYGASILVDPGKNAAGNALGPNRLTVNSNVCEIGLGTSQVATGVFICDEFYGASSTVVNMTMVLICNNLIIYEQAIGASYATALLQSSEFELTNALVSNNIVNTGDAAREAINVNFVSGNNENFVTGNCTQGTITATNGKTDGAVTGSNTAMNYAF